MIKAVIFDLDDTLISEKDYIKSGFKEISKNIEEIYKIDAEETFNELMKLSKVESKNVFNRFFDNHKIEYTKEDIKEFLNIYRNHIPNIEFYEDAIQLIEKLKEKNIKVGVITDGYIVSQKAKLKAINAYEIFDYIIITEELGREFWKPHPKAFEIMKEKLNVKFNEMIYVGDNPEKDFFIGDIYPINTIRIVREDSIYKTKEYLNKVKEKFLVNNLIDIFKIIGSKI